MLRSAILPQLTLIGSLGKVRPVDIQRWPQTVVAASYVQGLTWHSELLVYLLICATSS
jgi:hypothetical protein